MAKGKQKHKAHVDAVNLLGKDLARRAGRSCELCDKRDDCRAHETNPDKAPELDTLLLLCASCRELLARPGKVPSNHLRFVANHCWTDLAPLRQIVVQLLEPLSDDWAQEAMEQLQMMAVSEVD
jgi:protein PhnA